VKYISILVEGQTEEVFVRDVLTPYWSTQDIFPIATILRTKRVKSGSDFKGGITRYDRVCNDLNKLLQNRGVELITTMIDYYGLPKDFPKIDEQPEGDLYTKVEFLELAMEQDIGSYRFLPYLSVHEFEALLFTSPQDIATAFPDDNKTQQLESIKRTYRNPEFINLDNPPAKQISKLLPQYRKKLHGSQIVKAIGLDDIRAECPHFNQWLTIIESRLTEE